MDCTVTTPPRQRYAKQRQRAKNQTSLIFDVPLDSIRPSPENDTLYHPIDRSAPDIKALVASIKAHGVKEPLVITRDRWILSGHRRHVAARAAGLTTVSCRIEPITRGDDPERFLILLREFNRQREKSFDEKLREEVVSADPDEAYESLVDYRRQQAHIDVEMIEMSEAKRRATITKAKVPFINKIIEVLNKRRKFWPISERKIHYALLNDPPLIHAGKPDSRYANTRNCSQSLSELLTRARLAGLISMAAVSDETRPTTTWQVHRGVQDFLRGELATLLKGFWRDLMQSQPNHIEIIDEKNTLTPVIKPVAMEYCIPLTSGRGYCSLPPRHDIATRFRKSGKEQLVLLILSDHDPDGEMIAESFGRSMRDDFGIRNVRPIKVALTHEQAQELDLPPDFTPMTAKTGSKNYRRFVERYGDTVFELEALDEEKLQDILREAIDSVIDIDAFNVEVRQEREDAAELANIRRRIKATLMDQIGDIDMEDADR
jgi:hypothetical protein